MEPWALGAGGLCLALLVGGVAYLGGPVLVPVVIVAIVMGSVILFRPEVGVLVLLATFLFKYPKFLEGSGWLTINNLLGLTLSAVLLATVAVRKQLWFLKAPQVQMFLLLGLVMYVNWLFVARIEAPAHLSRLDLTGSDVERYITRLAFLTFFVAFIRTSRQLLLVTGVLLIAIFLTVPNAILHSLTAAGKVETLRAAATTGIEAARNSNYLAFICLMGITLIWFALVEYRGRLLRLLGSLAILTLVLTIVLSGSRAGLINLTLLPLLLLGQSGLRRGQVAAVIFLLVLSISVSLVLVPQPVLQRLGTILPTYEGEAVSRSTELRLLMQHMGLTRFWENPFIGVGIGNLRWMNAMDPTSGGIPLAAHNAYLLALAEGGIVLLAAYLLLFWQTFRDLGKALTLSTLAPEVYLRWLILATRTNLILLMVFSFFTDTWKEFYYLLILGTTAVLSQLYRKAAEQS
ncbi:MAG: O-antigen ligase family protein [Kofleriaceae bacterium]|nr:O-antigen ligase family protein [Candidatus Methylomirabilis lanthanidiphila]